MSLLRVSFFAGLRRAATPVRLVAAAMLLWVGSGCAARDDAASASLAARSGEPIGLLIQGYNYTDDYIESFTVNGQGGGNIFESGPMSGGSGSVCCFSFTPGTPLPIPVKVRWIAGYCQYRQMTKYGPTPVHRRGLWKETEALITKATRGRPFALEVHFFPDDHVEAAITEGYSPPRLKLERDEQGRRLGAKHDYPWCTDEQLR